jgi:hypothetical protein
LNVTVSSLFRNADRDGKIERYFDRVDALEAALTARGDRLHLILSTGDNVDGTQDALAARLTGRLAALVRLDHGGPYYGSVTDPDRFRQLALAANAAMGLIDDDCDAWLFVEHDLIWTPDALVRLIDDLDAVPAVAPVVLNRYGGFYDTWAFRMNGMHFSHDQDVDWRSLRLERDDDDRNGAVTIDVGVGDLVPLQSAGSVIALRGRLAREARFQPEDAIVGLCRDLQRLGAGVYLDPRAKVQHP